MHTSSLTSGILVGLPETDIAPETSAPLDPQDWDALRILGHRMVDDMLEHLRTIDQKPVWQAVPESVASRLKTSVPEEGIGAETAYEEFLQYVQPYSIGNTHPRFWGWVIGSGTPLGALAEMLAASMNSNVSGLKGSPPLVEDQVLSWLQQLLGLSTEGSGLLVSGGSMANILGLAVAVDSRGGDQVAKRGLALASRRPVLYTSTQTHFSVDKGVRMLGLGTDSLRKIAVDSDYRINLSALEHAIQTDQRVGLHPFCIVANAGTTNTGAFDDLNALADLAERYNLWLHVDGAFGAFAAFDPEVSHLVDGLDRADSVAFDLHKWMVVPIEAGAVLFKDANAQQNAFSIGASYVSPMPGGIGEGATTFSDRGPQLTRNFRALKVWMSIKAHGASAYRELVQRNNRQAAYLRELVDRSPELELLAPVPLNVVCFRYKKEGLSNEDLNCLNQDIVVRLQEDGIAAPSHTTLGGRFAIRVCIVNHRTRIKDLDLLVHEVHKMGRNAALGATA